MQLHVFTKDFPVATTPKDVIDFFNEVLQHANAIEGKYKKFKSISECSSQNKNYRFYQRPIITVSSLVLRQAADTCNTCHGNLIIIMIFLAGISR